jgi:4-amino-4-deoxy-L-arabinose transferase-like glycosyltransferase
MLLVVAIVAIYARPFVLRGWIPHDEGTIAQSADRVLRGEVPHRDFDEGYTGGLSYLHAAAFRAFGVRLSSLRWLLYLALLAFAAATYALSLRLGPPWLALALALLAVAWSVPNYFASLPSWYNLFLAAFAALAFLRWIESGRARWLLLAGFSTGVSVLVKQVGLYAVAAGLLFLAYRERQAAERRGADGRSVLFLAMKAAGALAFVVLLVAVFARRREPMDVVEFVLPGALLAGFLVVDEARHGRGRFADRSRSLIADVGPFLAGAALPILLFGAAFAFAGSLRPLLADVLVRSLAPGQTAESQALPLEVLLPALPYGLLLLFPTIVPARRERGLAAVLALGLAGALALGGQPDVYQWAWRAARSLPLVVAVAAAVFLSRPAAAAPPSEDDRARVFLFTAMAALVGLVQFPFPSPIYFCYVAPLAALAAAALVRADARAPRTVHGIVLVFFLAFAVVWMNRGYVFRLGRYFAPYSAATRLRSPRAGIDVPASDAREYDALLGAVAKRSAGPDLYAGPDCPEVYFLAGRRNVTRSFFDYQGELYERPRELLRRIESSGMTAVVVDRSPAFSRPQGAAFLDALRARFPESEEFGRFTLYWRSPASSPLAYNPLPR